MMMNRRTFLSSTLATIGLSAMRGFCLANEQSRSTRPKSLITLWLDGGPSQWEMFDPHPGSAAGGPTKEIPTATPGLTFSENLPRLAELSQDLAVVRSTVSKDGDHQRGTYAFRTGYRIDQTIQHPTIGAVCSHELPTADLDLPPYVCILSDDLYAEGGYLGAKYQAYRIGDPTHHPRNLRSPVSDNRMDRRLDMLAALEQRHHRKTTVLEAADRAKLQVDQAVRMMKTAQQSAFRIDEEPSSIQDMYGETPFGRSCLAARRLIEVGVRAVDIAFQGWDTHTDNFTKHRTLGEILDQGFSALLVDLRTRGLLDDTLIVCAGEFGRTPSINALDGRDHWPHGFSTVLAGGGVAAGQFIGSTDPTGQSIKPSDPVTIADLSATILTILGIDPAREFTSPSGRPIKLSEGAPVTRLLSSRY